MNQACRKFNGQTRVNVYDNRIIPATNNTIQEFYTRGLKKAELSNQQEDIRALVAENQRMRTEMEDLSLFIRRVKESELLK